MSVHCHSQASGSICRRFQTPCLDGCFQIRSQLFRREFCTQLLTRGTASVGPGLVIWPAPLLRSPPLQTKEVQQKAQPVSSRDGIGDRKGQLTCPIHTKRAIRNDVAFWTELRQPSCQRLFTRTKIRSTRADHDAILQTNTIGMWNIECQRQFICPTRFDVKATV